MVCSIYRRNQKWNSASGRIGGSMNIIYTEQVSKTIGTGFQFGPMDLSVAPGEIVGIAGPARSGKTTLLKLLWGFIKPDAGRISVFGLCPHLNQLRLRRHAGYLGPH